MHKVCTLNSAHHIFASKQHTQCQRISCRPASHKTYIYTLHFQGSSPFGSGLIEVSISSTPSSLGERGLDMFSASLFLPPLASLALASTTWIVTTGPFFRSQPTASGVLGTRSGAGATLTRFFRCFAKEKRRFFQLRVFGRWAGSFGGGVGAKVVFALEAEFRPKIEPILTDYMKQSSLYLLLR